MTVTLWCIQWQHVYTEWCVVCDAHEFSNEKVSAAHSYLSYLVLVCEPGHPERLICVTIQDLCFVLRSCKNTAIGIQDTWVAIFPICSKIYWII